MSIQFYLESQTFLMDIVKTLPLFYIIQNKFTVSILTNKLNKLFEHHRNLNIMFAAFWNLLGT